MVTGEDLRKAREAKGVSLGKLAAELKRDKGHLSRVERGDAREVTPALVRDYERALGVTVAATVGSSSDAPRPATVGEVRRRLLLGKIAVAAVGAAAPEPVTRLLDGLEAELPDQVGVSEVEAVEAAADLYMRMDLAHGGGMAAAVARSSLRWASRLVDRDMTEAIRERLSSGIGLLADRLGWALYDVGDTSNASELLTFALDSSARGPDRDLRAHIMLDLSTVMTDAGHPFDGVEVLRLALGDERISSAERANLHAVCARHCATAGQREAGLRHVALAEEALTKSEPALAPEWAHHITVSKGHHDSALGLALFSLGEETRAEERLAAALKALDSGRTRTGLRCRTRLAVLHMRHEARDKGEAEARRAVADAAGVRSARIATDLRMMIDSAREYGMKDLALELTASVRAQERGRGGGGI